MGQTQLKKSKNRYIYYTMNIQTEKLLVIEELLQTQEESVIDQIKAILEDDGKDHWEELPDYVKKSIERSDDQIKKGEIKPHKEVIAGFKKKFLK
jgi:hypothetical protein